MLQENRKVLANYRPNFLEQIEKVLKEGVKEGRDRVQFSQARDGSSILTLEREGEGYRLNSAFRPVQEAERWVTQFNLDYLENIILMFGMGNGIFVKSLLKRLGNDDKIVIYEPSLSILCSVLEQVDISSILSDARVSIVVEGINVSDFYFIMEGFLDWRNIDALCVSEHPGYKQLFIKSYEFFVKQIVECKELVHVEKHTEAHFAHQTIQNFFMNIRYISESNILTDFVGKIPEGFPAIIVSAGPSLDKNIDELKRAEGKAFILAVDSAVSILLERGIQFDAMITVDAKKNSKHIRREECREIPLFCGFMSKPEIFSFHKGKKVFIMGFRYLDTVYAEMGHPFLPINIGGSVATAAFSTCEKLGFKKIVLIGQDLAYNGELTHAGGMIKNIVNEDVGKQEIDGWSGGKVKSRYDWIIYRNWFESVIQQLPEVQVIDATEGGALIHGSEVMKLSEVIDQYCTRTFSMRELIEKEPPTFDAGAYAVVRDRLMHIEKEMKNVRRSSEEAVIICEQVIKLIQQFGNTVSFHKQAKRLTALNDAIVSQEVYQLLDYYVTDTAVEDLKEINQMTGNKEQDLLNTYISARKMYDSLIQAVKDLSGESVKEKMEIAQQCLEEQIAICSQALESIKQNKYDILVQKQTQEKLSELNQVIIEQEVYWILRPCLENEEVEEELRTSGNKELDLMNSYILENHMIIQEIRKFMKSGFVHRCLQRI